MSVADVEQAVLRVMRAAEKHGDWLPANETTVRYALVDPILWALGRSIWMPLHCLPYHDLGQRGLIDYALFDPDGHFAILIVTGTVPARRGRDRSRLAQQVRGMAQGLAVLTYGTRWEIYAMSKRARGFAHKRVECLDLRSAVQDSAGNGRRRRGVSLRCSPSNAEACW